MSGAHEDPAAAENPLLGQVLAGRYRLDRELGRGGMGAVFRAHHLALDRPVAVKVLHARLTSDPMVAKRFDREALAASKLDHPNCVQMLDAGTTEEGVKYLVMQLLEGRELADVLDGVPMPLPRALDLAGQMLRGLEHAHKRGLVHRDLKPENVFLTEDEDGREQVKLVDFGIVKLLAGSGSAEALTRAGLVFGTPRYMSPEQAAGGKIDERADLYAVGVILHEMIAGAPPFDADEAGILLRMHLIADPPPLPESVPAHLRAVVARLLEKSPGDRFASAREVRDALEAPAPAPVLAPAVRGPLAGGTVMAMPAPPIPAPPVPAAPMPLEATGSGTWNPASSAAGGTVRAVQAPMFGPAPGASRSRGSRNVVVALLVVGGLVWLVYFLFAMKQCGVPDRPAGGQAR